MLLLGCLTLKEVRIVESFRTCFNFHTDHSDMVIFVRFLTQHYLKLFSNNPFFNYLLKPKICMLCNIVSLNAIIKAESKSCNINQVYMRL